MLATSRSHHQMHTILVIILILTLCLCDNYSLHNVILYIINNVVYLKQMHLSATSKILVNSFHYNIAY